ncbi:putative nuclease HARBI1 [Ornithodoros turicata]|uniref:putative nuclease HARBI1 n=1 Tax=Ornithodoros turicata TaxID=34597 RepID=UPI00313950EE
MNELRELDEIQQLQDFESYPMTRSIRDRLDPFRTWSDRGFRRRYRFSKDTVRYIIEVVRPDLQASEFNNAIPPDLQVLDTLRLSAKGSYQDDASHIHGFSQPTQSRIVRRISVALASRRVHFIKFPVLPAEQEDEKTQFLRRFGFPFTVGVIDCTHIRIKSPGGQVAQVYINRKGYYSLNMQLVCDAKEAITNVVARWRGSAHDSRIWQESELHRTCSSGAIHGVLGDNGYATTEYLLTPLLRPRAEREERFNAAHRKTRQLIERVIGQLKNEFRCLIRKLEARLETAKAVIVAVCVLHNLAKTHYGWSRKTCIHQTVSSKRQTSSDEEDDTSSSDDDSSDEIYSLADTSDTEEYQIPPQGSGSSFRSNIIATYFTH